MAILYRLTVTIDQNDYERAAAILALKTDGWQEDSEGTACRLTLFAPGEEPLLDLRNDLASLPGGCTAHLSKEEEEDWLEGWKKNFTPIRLGSFLILPPWLAESDRKDGEKSGKGGSEDCTPVIIEPKSAFGTGQHETTALCLRSLDRFLSEKRLSAGDVFLDLGTGSGILAIAAALRGLTGLGLDTDPIAIDNALENAGRNRVASRIRFETGSVERAGDSRYSLIFANILAGPLIDLAKPLVSRLADDSVLILSGLLQRQSKQVEEAYLREGLEKAEEVTDGEWSALLFLNGNKR
ncbi:MAG: 50S ribosomal protein L11 methyltransferase [Desulfovibrio sp.]|nr:50S ribosomal protein L11 methyltransferase [Desulfovibrio sp.]